MIAHVKALFMIIEKKGKKGKNQAIISISALGCANFFDFCKATP